MDPVAGGPTDHVMMGSEDDVNHMHSLGLESNTSTAADDKLFYYHRGLANASHETPILVLIHGYPQT